MSTSDVLMARSSITNLRPPSSRAILLMLIETTSTFSISPAFTMPCTRSVPIATCKLPDSARTGARIFVYQPPPGTSSKTLMSSFKPKNSSVWRGFRFASRAISALPLRSSAIAAFSFSAVSAATCAPESAATRNAVSVSVNRGFIVMFLFDFRF